MTDPPPVHVELDLETLRVFSTDDGLVLVDGRYRVRLSAGVSADPRVVSAVLRRLGVRALLAELSYRARTLGR